MTVDWISFVPAMLLLLFPADRLLSSTVQLRRFDAFYTLENSPRHRPWWWVPALWLDPLRGFAGTLLLGRALEISPAEWALAPLEPYVLMVTLLGLGVICQAVTWHEDVTVLLAPLGYVAGVVAALTTWPVALFGLTIGLIGLFAFRQFHAFFSSACVAVFLLGFALGGDPMGFGPATGALALPVAAALVCGRTLELPTRDASGPSRKDRGRAPFLPTPAEQPPNQNRNP